MAGGGLHLQEEVFVLSLWVVINLTSKPTGGWKQGNLKVSASPSDLGITLSSFPLQVCRGYLLLQKHCLSFSVYVFFTLHDVG